MNKFLLAAALVVACSAPVLADSGNKQSKARTYVGSSYEHQLSWKKARRKIDREAVKEDPYWEPCDYMANGGPRACGGGGG